MFRSSRPDYIETVNVGEELSRHPINCSGLPDRTTLRLSMERPTPPGLALLFRSSRPDYIETFIRFFWLEFGNFPLFQSSRPDYIETSLLPETPLHYRNCSGLPDRTTLRQLLRLFGWVFDLELFRSSRPDYIETNLLLEHQNWQDCIVPVFQTGLH